MEESKQPNKDKADFTIEHNDESVDQTIAYNQNETVEKTISNSDLSASQLAAHGYKSGVVDQSSVQTISYNEQDENSENIQPIETVETVVDNLLQTPVKMGSSQQETKQNVPSTMNLPSSSQFSLQPGATIDKYEIVEELGKGGMGAVYRVRHKLLDKEFALKVMHANISQNLEFRERFLREAKLAMEFAHEHAVQIREFGETEQGHQYFTMDFSNGIDLKDLMTKEKLNEERALRIAQQILKALQHAHHKGIIHRDLKPANILMEKRQGKDHALVLDFGIAKALDSNADAQLTQGGFIGTPHYMSPEQANGKELDTRTDIFSVGIILYEMLTGNLPFIGQNTMEVIFARVMKDPIPPCKANPQISQNAEKITLKAIAKEREKRFSSADEMIAAIDDHFSPSAIARSKTKNKGSLWQKFAVATIILMLIPIAFKGPRKSLQKFVKKVSQSIKKTKKTQINKSNKNPKLAHTDKSVENTISNDTSDTTSVQNAEVKNTTDNEINNKNTTNSEDSVIDKNNEAYEGNSTDKNNEADEGNESIENNSGDIENNVPENDHKQINNENRSPNKVENEVVRQPLIYHSKLVPFPTYIRAPIGGILIVFTPAKKQTIKAQKLGIVIPKFSKTLQKSFRKQQFALTLKTNRLKKLLRRNRKWQQNAIKKLQKEILKVVSGILHKHGTPVLATASGKIVWTIEEISRPTDIIRKLTELKIVDWKVSEVQSKQGIAKVLSPSVSLVIFDLHQGHNLSKSMKVDLWNKGRKTKGKVTKVYGTKIFVAVPRTKHFRPGKKVTLKILD